MTLDYRMIVLGQHGVGREQVKVPTQPPISGLPLWAQLTISFIIGLATLAVAFKGYFIKDKPAITGAEPSSAAILAASITDGFAMRTLNESVVRLDAAIDTLTKAIDEHTHHERNSIELERELCARLRELREVLERRS
jgi:hypothetical protein